MSWLTADQWTAVGSIAGLISVIVALVAWFRPRSPKEAGNPVDKQNAALKVSGLRIIEENGKSWIMKVIPGET